MALREKEESLKDLNATLVGLRKVNEECHTFIHSAMKGAGFGLLLVQLEQLENSPSFDLGQLQNSLLAVGLLLEQFITLALAKSKVGKKFSVENVLASEEGKILKERLGKKLLILQNQLVEAAAD